MLFACDRCGRRYSVPDERVQGRAFRATCKACGNIMVVRPGGAQPAGASGPSPAPPVPGPTSPAPVVPLPSPPAATGPTAVPAAGAGPRGAPEQRAPGPPAAPAVRPPSVVPLPGRTPSPGASAPGVAVVAASAPAVPAGPTLAAVTGSEAGTLGGALGNLLESPQAGGPAEGRVSRGRELDTARGLTSAEMAWMADRAPGAPPEAQGEKGVEQPRSEAHPEGGSGGPGLPRAILAGVVLGIAAAGALALLWGGWRTRQSMMAAERAPPPLELTPPPAAPPAAAPLAEPTPQPVAEPTPQPAAADLSAAAPSPVSAAPAPPAPEKPVAQRAGGSAVFEPGTVMVRRSHRSGQRLDQKDRKLLDLLARKQDGTAPLEPVEPNELDSRSLDSNAVERVISRSQGAFSGCVSRASKGTATAEWRATLLLTVDGTGEVAGAWVAEADISRTGLGRCLATAARRLVFPAFEGDSVDISVPLVLEAR